MTKLTLDSTLPEWHRVPVHPGTHDHWGERQQELLDLADQRKTDPTAREKFTVLVLETEFQELPYFFGFYRMSGGELGEKQYACHPGTWERMNEGQRGRFAVEGMEEKV